MSTALKHIFDPGSNSTLKDSPKLVHAWQDGAPKVLCGMLNAYWEHDGQRLLRVMSIDEPVNCKACQKSLSQVARLQLRHLSPVGLEKVLDLIAAMRNGDLRE